MCEFSTCNCFLNLHNVLEKTKEKNFYYLYT